MNVDKQEIIDMIRDKSPRLELVCFDAGKSEAWRWFKRVRVDGRILPYAVCNGCFKPVHYTPRDGTGGLRRHACAHTMALAQAKGQQPPNSQKNDSRSKERDKAAVSPQAMWHSGSDIRNSRLPSPANGSRNNRRGSVPISLTLWAAEKSLVDLHNSAALSLSNLMAASPFTQAGINPFADLFAATAPVAKLPPAIPSSRSSQPKTVNKIGDIALDLAMKKAATEEGQGSGDSNAPTAVSQCRPPGRRPRKRSNPDRAVPVNDTSEDNLHMLAQVSQESKKKEARLSPDLDIKSHAPIKQEPLNLNRRAMNDVLASHARLSSPEIQSTPPAIHPCTESPTSGLLRQPVHTTSADDSACDSVAKFIAEIDEQLQISPESTLADAAGKLKLDDLKKCLTSLLSLQSEVMCRTVNKISVPQLQRPAPQFRGTAVIDGKFQELSLDHFKGQYVVLFFYPLDFNFACPTELVAFSDRADDFRDTGCEVIACSTDSHFSHLAWVNTPRKQGGLGPLNIALLADKAATIAKAYGVYKEDEGLPLRGLFVIDDRQYLRQVILHDLPVARSVDEVLRVVRALRQLDKQKETM